MNESEAKKSLVMFAKSLFDRGYAVGSAGNISMMLEDGTFLATPSGSSFGTLNEVDISHFDDDGILLGGKPPTKEVPLHLACYRTHPSVRSVVHLHATYSTLLASCEEHTSELQSHHDLVCRLLLEKKKKEEDVSFGKSCM